jgi:hypothetical protein
MAITPPMAGAAQKQAAIIKPGTLLFFIIFS